MLAQTIGYTPKFNMNDVEAKKRRGCKQMVEQNQMRDSQLDSGYQVGEGGIEGLYCSVLNGTNGKKISNQDLTNADKIRTQGVIDGANVYLTIDRNIQKKAEQILQEAVKANTNDVGPPKDGCVMVMEASSGKIMAMASYPSFDPNFYSEYYTSNPNSFRNNCSSNDYEVGSVMKPLTVAVGLQIGQNGYNQDGKATGIMPNYKFDDFDEKGKPYKDGTETIYIKNANNISWKKFGKIGSKEILRDSINTGIADIVGKIGNQNLKDYFLDKLEFENDEYLPNLPGDTNGDTSSFAKEIDCNYCYAAKGFGQGFSLSAIQLLRAYTAIANNGNIVQPTLVNKVICPSVGVNDKKDYCLSKNLQQDTGPKKSVFSKYVTDIITNYMVATSEEGFQAGGRTKATVDGYKIAIKSGTSQVSRPIIAKDGKIIPCDQNCNTQRGITDHTLLGFNTGESRYIVFIKLAQPKPGQVVNFSSATLSPYFSEMMKYTLNYFNIPKDN